MDTFKISHIPILEIFNPESFAVPITGNQYFYGLTTKLKFELPRECIPVAIAKNSTNIEIANSIKGLQSYDLNKYKKSCGLYDVIVEMTEQESKLLNLNPQYAQYLAHWFKERCSKMVLVVIEL